MPAKKILKKIGQNFGPNNKNSYKLIGSPKFVVIDKLKEPNHVAN